MREQNTGNCYNVRENYSITQKVWSVFTENKMHPQWAGSSTCFVAFHSLAAIDTLNFKIWCSFPTPSWYLLLSTIGENASAHWTIVALCKRRSIDTRPVIVPIASFILGFRATCKAVGGLRCTQPCSFKAFLYNYATHYRRQWWGFVRVFIHGATPVDVVDLGWMM